MEYMVCYHGNRVCSQSAEVVRRQGTAGEMATGGRMWVYQLFVQLMCVWWRQRDRLPILDSKVIEPQKAVCDREPLSVSTASIEKKVALELLAGSAWHHVELLE